MPPLVDLCTFSSSLPNLRAITSAPRSIDALRERTDMRFSGVGGGAVRAAGLEKPLSQPTISTSSASLKS